MPTRFLQDKIGVMWINTEMDSIGKDGTFRLLERQTNNPSVIAQCRESIMRG